MDLKLTKALMGGKVQDQILDAYVAMRKNGLKQVFHFTPDPAGLRRGIDFDMLRNLGETNKPAGLYWSEKLDPSTIAQLLYGADAQQGLAKRYSDFMRMNNSKDLAYKMIPGLVKPDAKIQSLDLETLRNFAQERTVRNALRSGLPPRESQWLANYVDHPPMDSLINQRTKDFITNLARKSKIDMLRVNEVDNEPGLTELIQTQPNVVNAFWPDKFKMLGLAPLGLSTQGESK